MAPKQKPKMSLQPLAPRGAEEFVKGANASPEASVEAKEVIDHAPMEPTTELVLPWEKDFVREDVIKSVNLRLPEPYILKLQFLSAKTNKSQQALIRDVLLPAIDEYVKEVIES